MNKLPAERQRAFVLLGVIFVLVVLSGAVAVLSQAGVNQAKLSGQLTLRNQAFFAAMSGLQLGISAASRASPDTKSGYESSNTFCNDNTPTGSVYSYTAGSGSAAGHYHMAVNFPAGTGPINRFTVNIYCKSEDWTVYSEDTDKRIVPYRFKSIAVYGSSIDSPDYQQFTVYGYNYHFIGKD